MSLKDLDPGNPKSLPLNDLTNNLEGYVVSSLSPTHNQIYKLFNIDTNLDSHASWQSVDVNNLTIDYNVFGKLGYSPIINKLNINFPLDGQQHKQLQISGSDNGTNWVGISEEPTPSEVIHRDFEFTNLTPYKWYRLKFKEGQFTDGAGDSSAGNYLAIREIKYYDPTGLTQEYFTGSLIRDTLGIALDEAPEYIADSITSAISQPVQLYTGFELKGGWNMFGWVYPYSQDVKKAFKSILGYEATETDIIIVKDNNGAAYLVEWGFNGIGDFIPGEGYQIKLPVTAAEGSPLIGTLTFPIPEASQSTYPNYESLIAARNATTRSLVEGWNMFGYNRSGSKDLVEAFNDCTFTGFAKEINHKPTSMSGTIDLFNGFNQVFGTDVNFLDHYEEGDTIKYDFEGVKYTSTITAVSLGSMNMQNNHTGPNGATEFYYKDQEVTNASITGSIIIVKDNNGAAYLREWYFNGVGDLTPGEGYQAKMNEAIHGFKFAEDDINEIRPFIDQ